MNGIGAVLARRLMARRAGSGAIVLMALVVARAAGSALEMRSTNNHGWLRIASEGLSNQVHTIEYSTSFTNWTPVAVVHDGPFEFADPASGVLPHRFYRLVSRSKKTTDDGKNLVGFPTDPFLSQAENPDDVRWIKFAILLSDTNKVWFQDSSKYLFHYDFASLRLAPFKGMNRSQFDAATLYRSNQIAVLGAVLCPPGNSAELGIQFVGWDPYPSSELVAWYHLVRSAIFGAASASAYYMPMPEQAGIAEADRLYLEEHGALISRVERWLAGDACYSQGWALGRLVFVTASEIVAAYSDGRLKPEDILLTDGVPPEVPYVAGIISLVPATPNSHVAILARSYGVPFVYQVRPEDRARAVALAGQDVLLRLDVIGRYCKTTLAAVSPDLDPTLRAELLALKALGTIALTPKAPFGAIAADATGLTPADTKYFGGKAANYGLLHRVIPANSEPAIAFSFDLWDAFLDQELPGYGRTLRQEIQLRTQDYVYPPDVASAQLTLAGIRALIRDAARFNPAQQEAVLSALAVFDPLRKVRFRSSTNVEDSEQFTGAGLYDSYSGCPADDLDGDTAGPCRCDADESNERGVFRAMQRVYASFYNDNAWLERLRFRVNENDVGMAVLAHHSFPDECELANGVATVKFSKSYTYKSYDGELATQLGAVSVANPVDGSLPELVGFSGFSYSGSAVAPYLSHVQYSNLVPLGAHVMTWQNDYLDLASLIVKVIDGYGSLFPSRNKFVLDLEYKKMEPGTLIVKQVRELPAPPPADNIAPFLLNQPTGYCVLQGERGDVFANHRLKCLFAANTRDMRLTTASLTNSIYTDCSFEFLVGTNKIRLDNGPEDWPHADWAFDHETTATVDRWSHGSGASRRDFALETRLVTSVYPSQPILVQSDIDKTLLVKYASPVFGLDYEGNVVKVSEEEVVLAPCPALDASCLLQNRSFTAKSGLKVETSFYWPAPPSGPSAGYTAPLVAWVQTRIFGLAAEPIVLRDYYSQTYHPDHHNFSEQFVFEPGLEPGLSSEALDELEQRNIRAVCVRSQYSPDPAFYVIGLNGSIRRLD